MHNPQVRAGGEGRLGVHAALVAGHLQRAVHHGAGEGSQVAGDPDAAGAEGSRSSSQERWLLSFHTTTHFYFIMVCMHINLRWRGYQPRGRHQPPATLL